MAPIRLARRDSSSGIPAEAIHANKSQNNRTRTMEGFRAGTLRVLVATDLAARGIDVDGVSHVYNYELPDVPETYVHRIGRTARAGASGQAVALCDSEERPLLKAIERLMHKSVPVAGGAVFEKAAVEGKKGAIADAEARAKSPASQRRDDSSPRSRQGRRPESSRPDSRRPEARRQESRPARQEGPRTGPRTGNLRGSHAAFINEVSGRMSLGKGTSTSDASRIAFSSKDGSAPRGNKRSDSGRSSGGAPSRERSRGTRFGQRDR